MKLEIRNGRLIDPARALDRVASLFIDDNAIAAYVANRLADVERSIIVEHLASCDDCLTLACAVAR